MVRHILCAVTVFLAVIASPVFAQSDGEPRLSLSDARHLLSRTGFGAAPEDLRRVLGQTRAAAVQDILNGLVTTPHIPMPEFLEGWDYPADQIWTLGQTEIEFFYVSRRIEMEALRAWWLREMLATRSPLTERLVIFWHDHFASGYSAHENPRWLSEQNTFFRTHAAGNFSDLVTGVLRDPAMLVALNNDDNRKDAPNENLAREFFELFTLGEGRGYGEADVKAAARTLTGETIETLGTPAYRFDAEEHDPEDKTLLGQTGAFRASDLVEITLSQPEFGPYIVEKLWLEFVSDEPDPAEITRLAKIWTDADLDLFPLLNALLMSDAFWAAENRGRLVKSPVQLFVGTVRSLGLRVEDLPGAARSLEELGEALFEPPNIAGWPGGIDWITDARAAGRAAGLSGLLNWYGAEMPAAPEPAMMTLPQDAPPKGPKPRRTENDLRVGTVFVTSAEVMEDGAGIGALVTLFDVSFRGLTWRSISLWFEEFKGEPPGISVFTGDCAPDCLMTWPKGEDDPHWMWFAPFKGAGREFRTVAATDRALMQVLTQALPGMLKLSRDQVIWTTETQGYPAPYEALVTAATGFRDKSVKELGRSRGRMVIQAQNPDRLGLGAMPHYGTQISEEFGPMFASADAKIRAAPVALATRHYTDATAWLMDLPPVGTLEDRAVDALLAVPLPGLDGMGAEDLLRTIILSPHYQVN